MTARLAMPVSDVTQPNRSRQGHACNETNASARGGIDETHCAPAVGSAVRLVYVDGLSCKEAAKDVDSPTGTVMSRLVRAQTALNDVKDPERIEQLNSLPNASAMGSHEFRNSHRNCRRSRR